MKKKVTLALAASLVACSAFAQMPEKPEMVSNEKEITLEGQEALLKKYMSTITKEELKDHLMLFASDTFEGRETGERGQKMAADYIAQFFFERGLTGPVKNSPNPYFQQFELNSKSFGDYWLEANGFKANIFEDFYPYGNFEVAESDTELVFAGYGLETETYSDFKNIDVKGKGVVILEQNPKDKEGNLIGGEANLRQKIKTLSDKGAKFVVVAQESDKAFQAKLNMYKNYLQGAALSFKEAQTAPFGMLFTSPSNAAKLLGVDAGKFEKALAKAEKKGESPAGSFSATAKVKAELLKRKVRTENVLGFIEGTDLKDEILVVTSHYDHVGVTDGVVYNGADDDGSGSTGLLEIVDAFSQAMKDGNRPRRSILFMTFTGEEKGLLGSEYYTDHPVFPLDKTVADLNIDMIGRGDEAHKDNLDFVYIIGSDMLSSDLHKISEASAKKFTPELTLDYHYNRKDSPERYYYRSDHYNFAKNGIPVIFYFNGTHEDYHQPTDTPDKIQYEQQALRAQLVFATAWELANRAERPVVDQKEEEKAEN
ncbi:M28 family peptidase [Limibacter armeniacum]|uniref:M28 family peptidase n=1 Tax=Limibacter armeniacum TaxID=466084 RepID=UPI002FE4FF4C